MENLTIKAINQSVDNMICRNQEDIMNDLFKNTDSSMSAEKINSVMIVNCLSLSVKLSVQAVLGILQESDVLVIDENQIAKLLLKHLSSKIKD